MKSMQKKEFFNSLPTDNQEDKWVLLCEEFRHLSCSLVVLDDDPTGTQSVYDIPVLTHWEVNIVKQELENQTPVFYILTNSRSLTPQQTTKLHQEIAQNLKLASQSIGRKLLVISRSDSTLRGHYPLEIDVLKNALDLKGAVTLLIPAFFDGGRYTIDDIHYVEENEILIPAHETPFAKDPSFGFQNSNLRAWIVEKSKGEISPEKISSISLIDIREKGVKYIANKLNVLKEDTVCIVNAATPKDLIIFALAFFQALKSKQKFIFRTAASIVPILAGLEPQDLLDNTKLNPAQKAGLTIIGSYVPKTTQQLADLKQHLSLYFIEISVQNLLSDRWQEEIHLVNQMVEKHLSEGEHVIVYTSRELKKTDDQIKNLEIGKSISEGLVALIQQLKSEPAYLIAKGGITSSDIATKGLGVKRAMVKGQILPGVPVWELGQETRFPKMPYIVFPGNVGGVDALTKALQKLI